MESMMQNRTHTCGELRLSDAGKAVKIKNLGVTRYGFSGPNKEVLADMGLCAEGIAVAAKELLND